MVKKLEKETRRANRHKKAREALESSMEELRENCSFCYGCELDGRQYNEAARALLAPFSPDLTVRQVLDRLREPGLEESSWCMEAQ